MRHHRRERERGFVMAMAVVIALLFFSLMSLLLLDSSRALQEAQRFRSKIIAGAMAENGVELAAENMITSIANEKSKEFPDGSRCSGRYGRSGDPSRPSETGDPFTIEASGSAGGVARTKSIVTIQGRVRRGEIVIDYASYSQ